MDNDQIILTIEEIYEKDFKVDARGYRPQEVDKLLDQVMHDYQEYNNIIKRQKNEIMSLNEDISKYKDEIRRLRTVIETKESNSENQGNNNVDMLRRISNLEKVVFGRNEN